MPAPAQSNRTELPITFGGLFTSADVTQVPDGRVWAMDSVDTSHNICQLGPRYGAVQQRPGYNAGDVGWGCFYSTFGGVTEYILAIQPNGSSTVNIYSLNPSGWVWTLLSSGFTLSDTAWTFRQYESTVYCANETNGIYMHTVGNTTGNNSATPTWLFQQFQPQFDYGGTPTVETNRPPYVSRLFNSSDICGTYYNGNQWYFSLINGTTGDLLLNTSFRPDEVVKADCYTVVTLSATVNLSNVDYVYFECIPVGGQGGVIIPGGGGGVVGGAPVGGGPILPGVSAWGFGIAQDTNALNYAWTQSSNVTYGQTATPVSGGAVGYTQSAVSVLVDISNIPNASKSSVTRMVFLVPCEWGNGEGLGVNVQNLQFGGAQMWDKFTAELSPIAPAISYAYAYSNPTTNQIEPAESVQLAAGAMNGISPGGGFATAGCWVEIDVPYNPTLYGQGYTQINVYRQSALAGKIATLNGYWHLIGSTANSNTSGTYAYIDSMHENVLEALPYALIQFSYIPITMSPTNIGVWKSYFLMLIDRKLYASWGGQPNHFLPPPDQLYVPPNTDDTSQGRTLYIDYNETQNGLGVVEQNLLYIATAAGVFAMIGDTMEFATPARLLPVSRGALGVRAMWPHRAGCVVAAEDGLWYYEATTLFNGVQDWTYTVEEITLPVRSTYLWLMNGNGSGMVVLSWQDEIWLFNQGRYMHLTKTNALDGQRRWEAGTYPTVVAVAPFQGTGIMAQLGDGSLAQLAYNDFGVPYTSDNGNTKTWSVQTGVMIQARQKVLSVRCMGAGRPVVTVAVWDGNATAGSSVSYTLQKATVGQSWIANVNIRPGDQFQISASGGVADTITNLTLVLEPATPGYGN